MARTTIDTLVLHEDGADIQRYGLAVARVLTAVPDALAQLLEADVCAVIVTAMATHRRIAGVIVAACGCLFNLTCSTPVLSVVVAHGSIPLLEQAAKELSGTAGVVGEAIGCLANIAWSEEHREAAFAAGSTVVPLAITYVRLYGWCGPLRAGMSWYRSG